jgi:hypothetical protein
VHGPKQVSFRWPGVDRFAASRAAMPPTTGAPVRMATASQVSPHVTPLELAKRPA